LLHSGSRSIKLNDNILVTGGAGFIGGYLVTRLMHTRGDKVIVYDNLSKGSKDNISEQFGKSNFTFICADMLDSVSLAKAVDASDIVFHLAANPIVAVGSNDPTRDFEQNVLATYNLLEAMKRSRSCKKIIFTSSSTVYGEAEEIPTSEKYSPLKPISIYGATKLACEAMISGYCNIFNFCGLVFRLANIAGPNSTHGVIHDFIAKLSHNPNYLEILGNGKQNKSYLYIDDCIDALLKLVPEMEEINFDIFNVGPSDRINVLDIAMIISKELSLDNVSLKFLDSFDGRGWQGDVREYLLNSSKLESFGWKPKYNSREAVSLTVHQHATKARHASQIDQAGF
jgi:UDP-glucose 4-epimerase